MNFANILMRFAREGDFNCFLLAGRYTVLDHASIADLMPLCEERDVSIIIGGVYNSGALIKPTREATFDYTPMDETWRDKALALAVRRVAAHETGPYWLDRARRIKAVCDRHGCRCRRSRCSSRRRIRRSPASSSAPSWPITFVRPLSCWPWRSRPGLWRDLKGEELVAADAPTPA